MNRLSTLGVSPDKMPRPHNNQKRITLMPFFHSKALMSLFLLICMFGSFSSWAADFEVTSRRDAVDINAGDGKCQTSLKGECTLRAAIMEANALAGVDTIILNKEGEVYVYELSIDADLSIRGDLIIDGGISENGSTTILGRGEDRVFTIHESQSSFIKNPTVEIKNMTMRIGKPESIGSIIQNESTLKLLNVKILEGGKDSRAVYNKNGLLEIKDSILTSNDAALQSDGGDLRIENARIENNSWSGKIGGAAIYLNNVPSAVIKNSFLINNTVTSENSGDGMGGAIYAQNSNMLIDNTTLSENSATNMGGAIFLEASSLRITNLSFLTNNVSEFSSGGGIFLTKGTSENYLIIENTTISENSANKDGGGLFVSSQFDGIELVQFDMQNSEIYKNQANNGAGLYLDNLNTKLLNSTISGNESASDGDGDGGGIYLVAGEAKLQFMTIVDNSSSENLGANISNESALLEIQNSIIANPVLGQNCSGDIDSLGNNIDSEDSCMLNGLDDQINTNPLIAEIALNGGDTQTHALLEVSPESDHPAIDKGLCLPVITADQRYYKRDDHCDIGAFEYGSVKANPGIISFSAELFKSEEKEQKAIVTLQRIGGNDGEITVSLRDTGKGAAITDSDEVDDYIAFHERTISWEDGDGEDKSFEIILIDDSVLDGDKDIQIELLYANNGAIIGEQSNAKINIVDDEYVSSISFGSRIYPVNESDGIVKLTVVRSDAIDRMVEFDLLIAEEEGGAKFSSDYFHDNGNLIHVTFKPQETTVDVEISLVNDVLHEFNENFYVSLFNLDPKNAKEVVGRNIAVVEIADDDSPRQTGEFSFEARVYSVNEHDGSISIPVFRTNGKDGNVKVEVQVSSNDVKDPSKYIETVSLLEFDHREEMKMLNFNIFDNDTYEGDQKRFVISLKLVTNDGGAKLGEIDKAAIIVKENDNSRFKGEEVTEDTRSVGAIHPMFVLLALLLVFRKSELFLKNKHGV